MADSSDIQDSLKHQYRSMKLEDLKALMDDSNISKNQKKKINKQIKWLQNVQDRRERRKEKKKEKAFKRKIKTDDTPDHSSDTANHASKFKKARKEKITTNDNFEKHVHVAVDLSFDDYMTNLDLSKLRKQVSWCYKENRRSTHPVQYHICGLTERMKEGMDQSYVNWDVHFDDNIYKRFSKADMVYLTSDSPNVISEIKAGRVYVIGGLVDHNKHKGLTNKLAIENGLETGRLPLEEHIDMKTRKVLTVNHVFDIIVAYCELEDWKSALLRAIPSRKGAVALKDNDGDIA
uniref:tRNA methyltransferase 10 homolog A-like n=1 Tax=Styela clava TaxID=7725 RepID=UPI00193986C7|nr:tRNA methyltransferase 10 homolog A-like [Styela clava]